MTINVKYATTNAPVKQVNVGNSKGYLDLVVNKNRNGKALRIANRVNGDRVYVTLDSVDSLIEALQLAKTNGEKMSVTSLEFDQE